MAPLISVASRLIVAAALVDFSHRPQVASPRSAPARPETIRGAEAGDDERFAMSLAADRARLMVFSNEPFAWGRPLSETRRAPASSVENALELYRRHHPDLSYRTLSNGVLATPLPGSHCAAAVLNQRVDEWAFAGTYREFERAFDRRFHDLENVVEGGPLGPPPAPESPMLTPVVINARMATGFEIFSLAMEQLEGIVVIFREFTDKSARTRCVRETYVRDATMTTLFGYDRNPERFARPR